MAEPETMFHAIDQHHARGEGKQAYDALKKICAEDPVQSHNIEVLWRLARATHKMAINLPSKEARKKELLVEGQKYAAEAVQLDESNFNAIKWAAVVTGALTSLLPTKEKIEQGFVFKGYLDKGLAIDPNEYSLLHMRGRFSFSVASLSWLERNVASALFAAPPKATYQEAIDDLLEVERIRPSQWIENLLYLAKSYIGVGDKANAAKYLKIASDVVPEDDADREALVEVKVLMKKYK